MASPNTSGLKIEYPKWPSFKLGWHLSAHLTVTHPATKRLSWVRFPYVESMMEMVFIIQPTIGGVQLEQVP